MLRLLKQLLFSLLFLLVTQLSAQTINKDYIDGEIYIKLKELPINAANTTSSNVNIAAELPFLQNISSTFTISKAERTYYFSKSADLQRVYRIKISESKLIQKYIEEVKKEPTVEYVERVPYNTVIYIPNDPSVGSQYHLTNIKAYQAWDISQGGANIVVAVVDNSIQTNHPDLAANIVAGRDVSDNDDDPNPPNTDFSHGTHVSGIIGAVTNNNVGISSVGFNKIKIMPVKATPNSGASNSIYNGYEGITWAAEHGAKIINMSWGGGGYSLTDQAVIDNAYGLGAILVAAAGNNSTSSPMYPAAYSNVVSVASTTSSDSKSDFSNYGSSVDLAAPGTGIYSTIPFNNYASFSGTSMASPLAASVFAFVWSVKPTLTQTELETLIKNTCDNIDAQNPGYIGQLGSGRINVLKAISCTDGSISPVISPAGTSFLCNESTITLTCNIIEGASYQWKKNGANIGTNQNTFIASETGEYSVIVTKTTCSIAAASVQVSVIPATFNILSAATTGCQGDSIALSVAPLLGVNYQWKKNGNNIGANLSTFYAKQSGNYSLVLSGGTCQSTSAPLSISFITLSPIITAGGSTTICNGNTVTLTANTVANATYQWRKDGQNISGATNINYTASQSGNYIVVITSGQCSVASAITRVNVTPYQAPTPTTVDQEVCEGITIMPGEGLQASAGSCTGSITNTYSYTGPTVGYDGGSQSGLNPSVVVNNLGSNLISKVRITITFEKKDQGGATTCPNPHGGSFPFNDELSFNLTGPNSTNRLLIPSGLYNYYIYGGVVTIVFEDGMSAISNGSTPTSGTFAPNQLLSAFNGLTGNGTWTLVPYDNAGGDPLCVSAFSVEITTTGVSQATNISWWTSETGGTQLATGNEYIPTATAIGTYTYYVQGLCSGACASTRIPATLTINESNVPAPTVLAYPISATFANEVMPFLKNAVVNIQDSTSLQSGNQTLFISDRAAMIDPITICNGQNILFLGMGCTGSLNWSNSDIGTGIIVHPSVSNQYSVRCKDQASGCLSPISSVREVFIQPNNFNIANTIPDKGYQTFVGGHAIVNNTITNTSNTTIKATSSIVLSPGFVVGASSVFSATIQNGCSN